mmetsp:Transcript_55569/g.67018  ORF Transcript_55569/g.67018 Transcript_55569/m.67018 type:complete len:292 (-) Transcript_55569:2447-3322(-)
MNQQKSHIQPIPPSSQSRFKFVGDISAPSELNELEEQTRKKQEDFQKHITSIEERIALWTVSLSREAIDREAANASLIEESVNIPIEERVKQIAETIDVNMVQRICRVSNNKDENTGETKEAGIGEIDGNIITSELPKLEECASNVQKGMLQFEHETFVEFQSQYFRPLEDALTKKTRTMMQNESTKSEKRQAATVMRFESHAGDVARGKHEEKARRIATLAAVERQVLDAASGDEKRASHFLEEVYAMKNMILKERRERQKQDAIIVDAIVRTQELMRKSVLESFGGSSV